MVEFLPTGAPTGVSSDGNDHERHHKEHEGSDTMRPYHHLKQKLHKHHHHHKGKNYNKLYEKNIRRSILTFIEN